MIRCPSPPPPPVGVVSPTPRAADTEVLISVVRGGGRQCRRGEGEGNLDKKLIFHGGEPEGRLMKSAKWDGLYYIHSVHVLSNMIQALSQFVRIMLLCHWSSTVHYTLFYVLYCTVYT